MAEENATTETKKSGGKGLIIVLIVLILVLIGVAGAAGYFFYTQQNNAAMQMEQNTANTQTTEKKEEVNPDQDFFQVAINDLVLNITNSKGREKLMKLSFALKSTNPGIESLVELNKAEMVDVVIQQISARNSEELLTVGGKELLKEELMDELNRVLNNALKGEDEYKNSIKNIFFTTFVIK